YSLAIPKVMGIDTKFKKFKRIPISAAIPNIKETPTNKVNITKTQGPSFLKVKKIKRATAHKAAIVALGPSRKTALIISVKTAPVPVEETKVPSPTSMLRLALAKQIKS